MCLDQRARQSSRPPVPDLRVQGLKLRLRRCSRPHDASRRVYAITCVITTLTNSRHPSHPHKYPLYSSEDLVPLLLGVDCVCTRRVWSLGPACVVAPTHVRHNSDGGVALLRGLLVILVSWLPRLAIPRQLTGVGPACRGARSQDTSMNRVEGAIQLESLGDEVRVSIPSTRSRLLETVQRRRARWRERPQLEGPGRSNDPAV